MEQKRVLITGCAGYLGSEMSAYFIDKGWSVYGIDLAMPVNRPNLSDFWIDTVTNMDEPPVQVDIVIHLACLTKLGFDKEHYQKSNVEGTKRVRDAYPKTPMIYASTCAMYNEKGKPDVDHPYPQSKKEAEQYGDVVFRMGSVTGANRFGHYLRVPDHMIAGAYNNKVIRVINPEDRRAISFIDWICINYELAARNILESGIYAVSLDPLVQSQTDLLTLGHMVRYVVGDPDVDIHIEHQKSSNRFLTGSNVVPNVTTDENALRQLIENAAYRYKRYVMTKEVGIH